MLVQGSQLQQGAWEELFWYGKGSSTFFSASKHMGRGSHCNSRAACWESPAPASMEMPLLNSAPFNSLISSTFLGSSPNEGTVIRACWFPHSHTKADCLLSTGKEGGREGFALYNVILVLKANLLIRHKSLQKAGSHTAPLL